MRACSLLLCVLAGSAVAFIEPEVGDVGTIEHCIKGSDDNDECKSCFEEREEDEEENGEEANGVFSPAQKCIDMCSKEAYTIKQLEDKEIDGLEYYQISLSPANECIMGCHCPTATGISAKAEDNDQQVQAIEYELTFFDRFGNVDAGYINGRLAVEYAEDGAEEPENQIELNIGYKAYEIEQDNGEERQRVEECVSKYFIATGKVGGITGKSDDPPEAPVQHHVGEALGQLRMANDKNPVAGCSVFDAEEKTSDDYCMYLCAKEYSVSVVNNSVVFVPDKAFISINCLCEIGFGIQDNAGDNFNSAHISFNPDPKDMCSSEFAGKLVVVKPVDDAHNKAFTMVFNNSKDEACLYRYDVIGGEVMGIKGSLNAYTNASSKGTVAFAMILAVACLMAFLVPGCMPKRGQAYNSVP